MTRPNNSTLKNVAFYAACFTFSIALFVALAEAEHVYQCDLSGFMVKLVDLHLIHTKIHRTQIFLIRRNVHTVYMWTEIPFCYASKSFMEDLICHFSDGAVLIQAHHRDFSVMPASNEQELILDRKSVV